MAQIHTLYATSILFSCTAVPTEEAHHEASTLTANKLAKLFSGTVPADLEEMARTLTIDDISEFLKVIKLADLAELFSENDVDGSLLITLTDSDLKDMGVASGFNRRKIVAKFKVHLVELKMKQEP